MARTRGKGNVAASNVPSMVEAVSSNHMISESAPSEPVENEEAAMTTMVVDGPEKLHKKEEETKEAKEVDGNEETKDGPDEAKEGDGNEETKDGSDESWEADKKEEAKTGADVTEEEEAENCLVESEEIKTEESKDVFYKSKEIDEMEESEDGLDNLDDEDEKEETENAVFKSEEGAQDAKEDEKVVPMGTDVSDGEKVEEGAVMGTDVPEGEKVEEGADVPGGEKVEEGAAIKEVNDLGKEENTPKKKAKRIRKGKKKVASNGADKSSGADKQGTSAVGEKVEEGAVIGTDVPEGEKVEEGAMMGTDVPGGEKVEEGAVIKEVKDLGKEENSPKKKAKRIRKKKKKVASNGTDGADKQGTSAAVKKDMKMADGMGLIFMCNAKTKMDCFRYKVFGLPASKKEMVAKIYEGMRLFLFDADLKLLYGIYKAASPGGYNIAPKAFKSGFPSQVRFHVLNDCLPLPEEKFKAAIKGNYYGRNKFNCQLSPEQVKDLCKLFQSEGKTINTKRPREVVRAEKEQIPSSLGWKRARRERARHDDSIPRGRDLYPIREAYSSLPPRSRDIAPRARDVVRAVPERISSSQRRKRSIRERARRDDRIPRGRDPYVRREVYSSPPPLASAVPLPQLPLAPYAYGRSMDDCYYRREAPLLDPRDQRGVDLVARPVEPLGYRDPYSLYREPLSREAGYWEPVMYREGLYPTSSAPAAAPTVYYRY